jgi:hypothetical protein
MFATRPESPYLFGTKKTDRTTTMTEAGAQHTPSFDGIDGTLGPIDPLALGVDPSDFAVHAGAGASSSSTTDFNYPLSGKEGDALLAKASFRDAIRDQIMTGKTGEKLVHLHDNLADYTEAFYRDSLEAQLYGVGRVEGAARDAARREFARREARKYPAFTNRNTRVVHIHTAGTPAFVTIHEMIHVYTHDHVYKHIVIVEGLADYFTEKVCKQNDIPFKSSYAEERAAMELLARTVGDTNLANFAFQGTQDVIRSIVDLKGAGTWDLYRDTVDQRRFSDAAELLRGAKGIHEAKTALEEESGRMSDDLERAKLAARNDYERATWGAEGKKAVALRPTGTRRIAGKTTASIERGGTHGIREHWIATLEMEDGSVTSTTIATVESTRTYVTVPEAMETRDIKHVKLSPIND